MQPQYIDRWVESITNILPPRFPNALTLPLSITNNTKCTAGGESLWYATVRVMECEKEWKEVAIYQGGGDTPSEAIVKLVVRVAGDARGLFGG